MSTTLVGANMQKAGAVVQVVNVQDGAVATGTTVLVFDDSIPQNTEGDQYMTLAITPTSATNILIIDVVASVTSSAATPTGMVALFQDSTANALSAMSTFLTASGWANFLSVKHKMVAGTVSATTFKVRLGADNAGTTTFNGVTGGRTFGGVSGSSITITEIKV